MPIAAAADVPAADVRRAAMVAGSLGAVARAALDGGRGRPRALRRSPCIGRSSRCSRSRPTDVADALARIGTAAVEWKLDGARVQVHKAGDDVRVFTRGLNDVTASVPEIVEALRGAAGAAS